MSITSKELSIEKKYLKETISVIEELIASSNQFVSNKVIEVNKMKSFIWENKSDMDGAELRFNLDNMNMDVFTANQEVKNVNNLNKSKLSPYFARIDFKEADEDTIKVYIGITGIKHDNDFYVFDWRTPIASLYYNYEKGKCQYESPAGIVGGEITLKRQYKISNQKMIRCFDSDISISDDYLQEVLASASGSKMKNIVDTIQAEQNKIIRNENDKVLIVQGAAGSGKTSVAMHRIAYILYRQNLNSNNILIFSPNNIFSEYISNVLPELGEDNVLQTTFSTFASTYFKDYTIENFSQFLDKYYNLNIDQKGAEIIRQKQSNKFCADLKEYMNNYHRNFKVVKDVFINENVVICKSEINKLLTNNLVKFSVDEKIDYIIHHICDVNGLPYSRWCVYLKQQLISILEYTTDIIELYNNFLNKEKLPSIDTQETKIIAYEDITPLLYILFRVKGFPYSYNIKQVVIDEAQDYNLMQFELIKDIFSGAKFTILGDVNQTINPFFEYNSLNEITSIFGYGKYIELDKTYRSSEEIITYSNKILGLKNVCAMRHENKNEVRLRNVREDELFEILKDDISNMRENNMKRIAVICKDCEETKKIYDLLKGQFKDIASIKKDSDKNISDLTILPSFLSKGLEFDGVIIYTDKNNRYTENEKKLYYVACTRAQHMLTIYNQ